MPRVKGSELIPAHCRDAIEEYILYGTDPDDSFLRYILQNDLVHAFGSADDINQRHMRNYAQFLYSYAPRACWGSNANITEWVKIGGIEGLRAQGTSVEGSS